MPCIFSNGPPHERLPAILAQTIYPDARRPHKNRILFPLSTIGASKLDPSLSRIVDTTGMYGHFPSLKENLCRPSRRVISRSNANRQISEILIRSSRARPLVVGEIHTLTVLLITNKCLHTCLLIFRPRFKPG